MIQPQNNFTSKILAANFHERFTRSEAQKAAQSKAFLAQPRAEGGSQPGRLAIASEVKSKKRSPDRVSAFNIHIEIAVTADRQAPV